MVSNMKSTRKEIKMGFHSRGHPTDRDGMPPAARYVTLVIFFISRFTNVCVISYEFNYSTKMKIFRFGLWEIPHSGKSFHYAESPKD